MIIKSIECDGFNREFVFPNECPRCHHSIAPSYISKHFNIKNEIASLMFSCANCGDSFLSEYSVPMEINSAVRLLCSFPNSFKGKIFEDQINKISKKIWYYI